MDIEMENDKLGGGDKYYNSYEDLEVHRLMLADKPRVEAYKNAFGIDCKIFKDKVVMDVGAGTGILSVLCAKAGAKVVYAVEASKIAEVIGQVASENSVSDVIKVLQNRVEDVVLEEKVDIIVSEWMGFYLLHEGMLDSIIFARDKFLKPDGLLFPQKAQLFAAACSVPQAFHFWSDVSEVKMTSVGKCWREARSSRPELIEVKESEVLTESAVVCEFDLMTVSTTDLDCIKVQQVVSSKREGNFEGVCLWFDVIFPGNVKLSTSPSSPATHWKQTAVVFPYSAECSEDEPLAWDLILKREGADSRCYNISLEQLDPESVKHPMPCNCYFTKCVVIKAFMSSVEHKENMENGNES